MKTRILCAALLLGFGSTAQADMFQPSHNCWAPTKPYDLTDEWQVRRFNDEVAEYKRCIEDFIEDQNDAIRTHQTAAEDAVDDWNNFVNFELN